MEEESNGRYERFKIVPYEVWVDTLDSIIKIQEETISELKERIVMAEKEHDKMLLPYAKQFYFQKLTAEYTNYLENKLMRKMAERLKDAYVFAINEAGLPMLLNKKTYELSMKLFGGESEATKGYR